MQKAFFGLLLFMWCANTAVAQSDSTNTEIGFSTQFVFDNIFQSSSAPFELILKKQTKSNLWMRYGIGADFADNIEVESLHTFERQHQNTYLRVSIGTEKRKQLSNKWLLLYGADLQASFQKSKYTSIQNPPNDHYYSQQDNRTLLYGGGVRPFLGIGFNITPRLYVSTEASVLMDARFGKASEGHTYIDYVNNTSSETNEDENIRRIALGVNPASAIFIYYRF